MFVMKGENLWCKMPSSPQEESHKNTNQSTYIQKVRLSHSKKKGSV